MSDSERQQFLAIIARLTNEVAELRAEAAKRDAAMQSKIDALLRQLHGKRSERGPKATKMPPVDKALGKSGSAQGALAKRREHREELRLNAVDAGEQEHHVPDAQKVCARCGDGATFREVGTPKMSELYDFVPGYFRRSLHAVQTVACTCGTCIVAAQGPERATPKSKYGPGLAAWLIVQKCMLSMPIHRLEKLLRSQQIPISRSTMNELLLRVSGRLDPIGDVLVEKVRGADVVLADETPIKLMSHDKKAWLWVFLGDGAIVYRFATGRGSVTATEMLGGTKGTLLTDDYSGYKPLLKEGGRDAAACLAHIRRKFHESLPTAPEAQEALDLILEVYRVEREVQAQGLAGTDEHLQARQQRAGPALDRLGQWLAERSRTTLPKSPLGMAIAHAQSRWKPMTHFLKKASVPVDNNASERALRVVALGRKNFYGAGSKDGGAALATLYSLVATCEAQGVEPLAYLRDVIVRVGNEPAENLTPAAWAK